MPQRLRSGAVSKVACNAWLVLLGVFIQIAIEIEIVPLIAVDDLILSNLVSPSTQMAQHCGHAVQLHLAALVLRCQIIRVVIDWLPNLVGLTLEDADSFTELTENSVGQENDTSPIPAFSHCYRYGR
jgi:hypothetical protein